jgi:hypothetical protein
MPCCKSQYQYTVYVQHPNQYLSIPTQLVMLCHVCGIDFTQEALLQLLCGVHLLNGRQLQQGHIGAYMQEAEVCREGFQKTTQGCIFLFTMNYCSTSNLVWTP